MKVWVFWGKTVFLIGTLNFKYWEMLANLLKHLYKMVLFLENAPKFSFLWQKIKNIFYWENNENFSKKCTEVALKQTIYTFVLKET